MLDVDWSISVYGRNEAETIYGCLEAILNGIEGQSASITVMLNGCTDKSPEICRSLVHRGAPIQVYLIPFPDKSNAWNQFVYSVRPRAKTYFFVDAYAAVTTGSLASLDDCLAADSAINAAAALPSCGRSAMTQRETMIRNGYLHGSLFALSRSFVDRITSSGLRLPVGLYRGDGLITSMAAHNLDAGGTWMAERYVRICPTATWYARRQSIFRPRDFFRQYRRLIRQARGRFENAAISEVVRSGGFAGLPATADVMIQEWIAKDPSRKTLVTKSLFAWLAWQQISKATICPAELRASMLDLGSGLITSS